MLVLLERLPTVTAIVGESAALKTAPGTQIVNATRDLLAPFRGVWIITRGLVLSLVQRVRSVRVLLVEMGLVQL